MFLDQPDSQYLRRLSRIVEITAKAVKYSKLFHCFRHNPGALTVVSAKTPQITLERAANISQIIKQVVAG